MNKLLFIFPFLILANSLFSQSCEELIAQYKNKRDALSFEELKFLTEEMIDICSESYDLSNENRLESIYLQGAYFENIGKLNKADSIYRNTYKLINKNLPENHKLRSNLLNSMAYVTARLGNLDSSLVFYNKALNSIEEREGKSKNYSEVLFNKGDTYVKMGNYKDAYNTIEKCRVIFDSLGIDSTYTYANIFLYKAHLLGIKGDHKAAIQHNKVALKLFRNIYGTEHWYNGYALINLARSYSNAGLLFKSVELWEEALGVYERTLGKGHPFYSNGVYNYSALLNELGQYQKSLDLKFEAYEKLKETAPNNPDLANLLIGIGRSYTFLGQYDKALSYQLEALSLSSKTRTDTNPKHIALLPNIASTYIKIGQFDKAEKYYKDALEKVEQVYTKEHFRYTERMSGMGYLYEHKGDHVKALEYYKFAYDHGQQTYDSLNPQYLVHINNLAIGLRNLKRYAEALPYMLEAIEKTKKVLGTDHPKYSIRLNSLGVLYRHLGEFQKAKSIYQESLILGKKNLGIKHIENASSLKNAGLLYDLTGQPDSAFLLYQSANNIIRENIEHNFSGLSETEKESFFNQYKQDYDHFKSFTLNHREIVPDAVEMIFNIELVQKGQLLANTKSVLASIRAMQDDTLLMEYMNWLSLKKDLAFLYAQPQSVKQLANLDSLEEVANTMERELVKQSSTFEKNNKIVTFQELKKQLSPREAVIEFSHFQYRNPDLTDSLFYVALIYHKGMTSPKMIPLFEEKHLEALLKKKTLSTKKYINKLYNPALYKLIWEPIDSFLTGVETVYFAPTGLLHRIAFSALSSKGTHLNDRYNLNQFNSTRNLVLANDSKKYPVKDAVIYGGISYETDSLQMANAHLVRQRGEANSSYELDFLLQNTTRGRGFGSLDTTLVELNKLEQLFKSNYFFTMTLDGYDASEESFKAIGNQYESPDILHIATHGFFFPDALVKSTTKNLKEKGGKANFKYSIKPLMRSGLILAGANRAWKEGKTTYGHEDGILTSYEISNMNLNSTKLVVLSACNTGLGEIKGSEGVYGLQRAFKMAGVDYLMITLWNIPDSHHTVEFMETFYTKWLIDQLPIREAFSETQKEMRKKYIDPYYWAGFQLIE